MAPETFLETLRLDGWVRDPEATLVPLTGGVSSDIYLVKSEGELFVVKRALARLRVREEWYANVGRNVTEQNYLRCVARFLPDSVPRLLRANPEEGYFSMEFLDAEFENWKRLLLCGVCEASLGARPGIILSTIHSQTSNNAGVASCFDTTEGFRQLRIDPYLLTTGARHPGLQRYFEDEARRLEATREALVHGDFSPKNILINGDRMVVLDGEAAWYGDPAFDIAFFLNHLFLKSLWHAPHDRGIEKMVKAFWSAYAGARDSDSVQMIEKRLVPLLLMLLLARVDGKSPVEYLTESAQKFLREFVHKYLVAPPASLAELTTIWFSQVLNFPVAQSGP
jgi:aminoglycoside phosphotransferase (APT) family kinase protein